MERVDGTQARLKQMSKVYLLQEKTGGKGGWDSGEIETFLLISSAKRIYWWKGWMGLRRD
mgnify:CR=1 FL=1